MQYFFNVVDRAKLEEDKHRPLAEDWAKKHTRTSYRGRSEGSYPEADGCFTGKVEGVGFRRAIVSTSESSTHWISQIAWKTLKSSG